MSTTQLPVAVIGAGPVGLAAAAHLTARGIEPVIFEAGEAVGASVREWGHVRVFSPWSYNIDPVAAELLAANGWSAPAGDAYPTGEEIIARYLEPLAAVPGIAESLHLRARVASVNRSGVDKLKDAGREGAPYQLVVEQHGEERRYLARAVIDASGTWTRPNPLGAGGVPAAGERDHADRIAYGIPDVLGTARSRYAGRRVLVVGSGHSAFNAILDLVALRDSEPTTEIVWAIRGTGPDRSYGGGGDDQLPARGALGASVRALVGDGSIELAPGFQTRSLAADNGRLAVEDGHRRLLVDEVIAATGFRPDLDLLRELRLDLDDRVEAPRALAPLIDPNLHSCGSVPPHGVDELSHPDAGVYMVGMKSYGRAPTFLLRTGYEQVRSVVAALAGDWERARNVELGTSARLLATADACHAITESRLERPAGLTEREAQVVAMLARGLQTKQIAGALWITVKTADHHIQNAYRKIGVSTRAAATLFAVEHALVASGELASSARKAPPADGMPFADGAAPRS
jgi:DNA-binding CsgD family transcriptional regulator